MECNTDVGLPFKVLCDLQAEEHLHFSTFFFFYFGLFTCKRAANMKSSSLCYFQGKFLLILVFIHEPKRKVLKNFPPANLLFYWR